MSMRKLLFAATTLAVAFTVVRAEEDEDELEDNRNALAGLTAKTIFPEYHPHEAQITAGEATKALVKFENNAEATYTVEFISAHLANPSMADQITMNLTGMLVNRTVNQAESVSMEYKFTPFKDLDPKEYNLVVQVYIMGEDDDRNVIVAFNETIAMIDGSSTFDIQGLFLALLIGGGFFLAYNHFTGRKAKKSIKSVSTPAPTRRTAGSTSPAPDAAKEGDIDLSYVGTAHLKAARARSGSPKKKN